MSYLAKFDVETHYLLRKLAAEITQSASNVEAKVNLVRTPCVSDTELTLELKVKGVAKIKELEELRAFIEAVEIPDYIHEVSVSPYVDLTQENLSRFTLVSLTFIKYKSPELSNPEVCNILTRAANYLENNVKTST